jgi:hypothetical protein
MLQLVMDTEVVNILQFFLLHDSFFGEKRMIAQPVRSSSVSDCLLVVVGVMK